MAAFPTGKQTLLPVHCVIHADEQGCPGLVMSRLGVTMGLHDAAQVALSWESEGLRGRFAYGFLGIDVLGSFSVSSIEFTIHIFLLGTESATIVNAHAFVLCFGTFSPNRICVHLGFCWLPF